MPLSMCMPSSKVDKSALIETGCAVLRSRAMCAILRGITPTLPLQDQHNNRFQPVICLHNSLVKLIILVLDH